MLIGKTSRALALLLGLLLALTIGAGAAGADNNVDQQVADEITKVYPYLDPQGKTDINAARENVVPTLDWGTILDPILTSEVVSRFESYAEAIDKLSQLLIDLAKIQYADPDSSPGVLISKIQEFREDEGHRGTITALLGSDFVAQENFDAQDLLNFYLAVKDETEKLIKDDPTGYALSLLSYEEDTLKSLFKDAVRNVLAKNEWAKLKDQLEKLGLGNMESVTERLSTVRSNLSSAIDPNHDAERALIKAYLRSETKVFDSNSNEVSEGDSVKEGNSETYSLSILGISNLESLFSWTTSDSSIAVMGKDNNSNNILSALDVSQSENVEVIVYYGESYSEGDTNWVKKFNVTIIPEPATGGTTGGGGGGGGAATEPSEPGEAADKAEDVVNDPGAADDEVADAVDNAAESLDSSIGKAESPEDVEKAADTAGKLSETLVKAAKRIQDADAAGKVGEAAAKLAGALAKAAEKAATGDAKNKIEAAALNILDAASAAVDKMDAAKAIDVAGKMIQSTGTIAKALKGEVAKNIAARAARLAQEAVERAGTDKISQSEVKLEGDKASVEADPVRLKERAEEAIRAAKELAEQLKENGLDAGKRLQARVVVEVPATGKEQVETKLPAGTLEVLADAKVDKLEVKTEVASFSVAPDTFGEEAGGKDVVLAAARVKREDLPAVARNRVPSNSIVVDLNASVGGSNVSNFAKPVEVSIPYTLGEDENPGEVTVFLLKDDGSVQKMGGKYDPVTGTVKFRTSHFSKYFARTARGTFSDLGKFKWAKDTIEIMAGKGFIAGRTATAFDPGADITRAEFSALAVRMLALSAPDAAELPFKDVPEDAWYRQVVAAAYANNVVSGKAADIFDPDGKITRQEMAVIISRIMMAEGFEPGNVNDLDSFTDKEQIAGWARNGAALATREGIVKGIPGGKFAPGAKANRAQAAVMLYRLFNKLY